MMMPDVSVIIPAWNSAETLDRTLRSVRSQSHARWEAIVINDGSHDATAAIASDHAREDDRIKLINKENAGAGAARNAGLANATGEWIVFLDADDTLAPTHLARMLRAMREACKGHAEDDILLHCGWRRRREGRLWWSPYPARWIDNPFTATTRGCPFAIHSAMTRRSTILAAGGFDPALRIAEDWDLWQRIARRGARFVPVSGLWADVHVRAGSLSGDTARHLADGLAVIRRGHSADPRVADPAPEHAAGAPVTGLQDALWCHALWLAGTAIGRGADWLTLLTDLRSTCAPAFADIYVAVAILEDSLGVGAALPEAPWPQLWERSHHEVAGLIAWLELGEAGERLFQSLEHRIAARLAPNATARIGSLQRQKIDLAEPLPDLDLTGVHRLQAGIALAGLPIGTMELAPMGPISGADLRSEILERFDSADLRQRLRALRGLASTNAQGADEDPETDDINLLLPLASGPATLATQQARIAAILTEERAEAGRLASVRAALSAHSQTRTGPAPGETVDYKDEAYWEGIFSAKDPWDYRNSYEALKYDQTIDLLDGRRFSAALEIACAEGEFTRRLAPLCDHVLATDIAPSAVERAAAMLADLGNVGCRQLDLLTDDLPGDFDLIVCSEVLYYLEDEAMLGRFCTKVADHLRPGGWFITAHAKLTVDEPDRTGFGWPHHFGATGIGNAFAATPGIVRDAEFETPIYRIQRFRRLAEGEAVDETARPLPRQGDAATPLPTRIAEMVKWRGGKEIPDADTWRDFPVLMYHRIADDGPVGLSQWRTSPAAFAAQLAWLADNGWQGISFERMTWAVHWGTALPPRSVMLTFDDATRDFLDTALPLLHRYGFPATLFVPTGHIGAAADWDAAYGPPAPILGWDEIAALRHMDVTVASHGSAHQKLSPLDGEALLRDLVRSKAELEAVLDGDVRGLAYPFGDMDQAVAQMARKVGYAFGFTCIPGLVTRASDPLVLPRIEVKGGISIADFAELLRAGET